MSTRLLAMAVGPVQSFISAARRTRDLWFGSHLLSEVSKASALSLQRSGGSLIFPSPLGSRDLEPGSPFTVPNKILVELPGDVDPGSAYQSARQAGIQRWMDIAEEVRGIVRDQVRSDIWFEQIGDVVQTYGAWVDCSGDHRADHTRVEKLLSGRKALRDFLPATGHHGIPKSSLDGARESVLVPERIGKPLRRRARLGVSEQLDAIGLVKRLGGGARPYPSIARFACDPWVRKICSSRDGAAVRLLAEVATIGWSVQGGVKCSDPTSEFPPDGSMCYASRIPELAEAGLSEEACAELEARLRKLERAFGQPSPYMAILKADGDKMGELIGEIGNIDGHRRFSKALSTFASSVAGIIQSHRGALVYSGGDDVLALLPVDTCLKAARDIYTDFGTAISSALQVRVPTMSIGIAICHFMEPMGVILDRGRSAERLAKEPDRNGLAVSLHKRSGGEPVSVRRPWTGDPDEELQQWVELFSTKQISAKAAYDLNELAVFYQGWDQAGGREYATDWLSDLILADAQRLLVKKRSVDDRLDPGLIRRILEGATTPRDYAEKARMLVLARCLGGWLVE